MTTTSRTGSLDFPDDLINEDESAVDLKQKKSTLRTWRSTGKGPDYWRLGRSVYYSRSTNANWKAQQRRSPRVPTIVT
jgi:hypothetical protein